MYNSINIFLNFLMYASMKHRSINSYKLLSPTLSFQPGQIDRKTKPSVTYHALIVNLIRKVGRRATSWRCPAQGCTISTGPYTCRGARGAEGKGRVTSQHNTFYCSNQLQKDLFHITCLIFTK